MKKLWLIRHAKSSWKDDFLNDFDRPLNKRGKRNAPDMGKRLAQKYATPDMIISSSAKRALKTAKIIAEEIGYNKDCIVEKKKIYEASAKTLLKLIHKLPNEHEKIIMFGHNPSFTDLANDLVNESIYNIPTCGVVYMEFDVDAWDKIETKSGKLIEFDYPKKC